MPFRPDALTELIEAARAAQFRFLIYDRDAGPKIYPALSSLLSPESRPARLTPIYIEAGREFVIYRIEAQAEQIGSPIARLEQGVSLQKFEINLSRPAVDKSARDIGVYLYWQVERALTPSLKVFVHILGEGGQLVAQDDSLPAVWTYPTSAWPANEMVIDFHRIRVNGVNFDTSYTIAVGLYDEATGIRLGRLDARAHVIDDKIVLQTLNLSSSSSAP